MNRVPLTEVASMLKGRFVVETHVIRESRRVATHFWGLHGGHTLVLRQQDRRFVEVEERPHPLGIAVNLARH
ncbi:MAG: hypothetical protein A2286_00335 [Gammaproteobacteria bacterium RIFOXYA12_FULL_61_12]|nr:MAG: hypothetical protein A2514_11315 [Gammaproteobacteria bacterium RIFOXYD12_FULL_61_37]OGT94039.1 MAG: hypothetical protein A2286_00335 [Gammaproteobacteria bacterium RIFOXYA12_FULL_61_12]